MKKLFLFAALLTFTIAQSQTVDEVVSKYTAKIGGYEKFKGLKTLKMSGTLELQGNEIPLNISVINGRAVRTEADVMGEQVISCYKDGKGWTKNQFAGMPEPTDLSGTQLSDLKQQTSIGGMLLDYKAQGNKATLLGQEDVDGAKAFKIEVVNKDDQKSAFYYINATDFSLIKSATEREIMGSKAMLESYFSDPIVVDGLTFYKTRIQKVDGQVIQSFNFDKIEVNVPVDEKIFDKP